MRSRRDFLSLPVFLLSRNLSAARELGCDVAVIGGGTGGCAAALAAARNGLRVVLTEETGWLGGQLTAQAVPPDEHPWIEMFGCTLSYRHYRQAVREYYRRNYPLAEEARAIVNLNPGGGGVSKLTHEPRVSLAVIEEMLAPHIGSGRLTVLLRHKPVAADVSGDRVAAVAVKDLDSGASRSIYAAYFLDATEQGDLLPLTRTEYVTGFESQKQTGEPHAPAEAQPNNIQSFTCCFAMDHRPGEDYTIDKPEEYSFWRDYKPDLNPAWSGKLLDWTASNPSTLEARTMAFDPECDENGTEGGWWLYRRIARKRNFTRGAYGSDITLVNWPQNDYWLGNIHEVSEQEAARNLRRAKQLSLSLLYWMQTEAPRKGGYGWKGLRLRPDIVGAEDGLAKYPYIRESRRIQAEFTVLEQHVGTDARMKLTGKSKDELTAEQFADSDRQLPDRPAPQLRRRQLHRHQQPALSDSAWRPDSQARGKPAGRVQEPGRDPHHQWLLPASSGRVERGRSGGPAGCRGDTDGHIAAEDSQYGETKESLSDSDSGTGRRNQLA